MAVLSVDLAHKKYADIGAAVLATSETGIRCWLVPITLQNDPVPELLADFLHETCREKGIEVIILDGPQGWKRNGSELVHCRRCERELNTPAKTGEPFSVLPNAYTEFVKFSVAVYDALTKHGWRRLSTDMRPLTGPVLVESFPYSAWRTVGLPPLPSKRRAKIDDIKTRVEGLRERFGIEVDATPNHDQLQAIVAGLAGLLIEQGKWEMCRFLGADPVRQDEVWREGWIVNRNPL